MFSLRKLWVYIRTVSGDNDYEVYLENFRCCRKHNKDYPLSRAEYFQSKLEGKWNKINRCC
ncbi:MAG: putative selenoprotein [Nitrosomonadales bacterium]|nr:putative selenoprotein [Nitrosomonadales bacterium]MBT3918596.1 putative selenoprotein [Nitrosomonadales bacterium]MBT4183400.1 putative selenoprotein [Nitrosomonadales bacterium]MBT4571549.1 putative selenoprotein [Nitrosomonadales bacterium]MBT5149891.1 putative selenoprotein [Nitrosomonadales bacterium]